jgi:hypothetical protein
VVAVSGGISNAERDASRGTTNAKCEATGGRTNAEFAATSGCMSNVESTSH